MDKVKSYQELLKEIEALRLELKETCNQLEEANDTIEAIRSGQVDALVIKSEEGHQLYTLKNADQSYRIFIEQMTEGAVTLDREGHILYCNSQFALLIGLALEKVIGKSFFQFLSPECKQECRDLISKAWSGGTKGELNLLKENGQQLPVLLSLKTLDLTEGLSLSIILTDLSGQKQIQQLLQEQNARLEEAQKTAHHLNANLENTVRERTKELEESIREKTEVAKELRKAIQQKDDFISIASHELKTPFTSLKASLQLLDRMKLDPSSAVLFQLIEQANRSMEKTSNLIEDLLNATRITEGHLLLNKTTFNITEMLKASCSYIRSEDKHEFIIKGDKHLQVLADESRIDQVIVNLINNAIKYAPGSTQIILTVEKEGGMAKVSVKDTGPGIQEKNLSHLFDRYYRVDNNGNQYSGLGLGLYICSEIIKKHDGKIGVESKIGKGSTFWFTLPLPVNGKRYSFTEPAQKFSG